MVLFLVQESGSQKDLSLDKLFPTTLTNTAIYEIFRLGFSRIQISLQTFCAPLCQYTKQT